MTSAIQVRSLICHRDVAMGLQCLASLARSVPGTSFLLHDDGSLTDEDVHSLENTLPVAAIVRRREADEFAQEALRRHPACASTRGENVLMLKLFDVALMCSDADIRYCDTDVLFFRRIPDLFRRTPNAPAAVFMRDPDHAYSARPWHLWGRDALRLPRNVNTGLFMVGCDRFDLDFLDWLLSREEIRRIFAHIPGWAEQTCWAALGMRAGCGLWDASRIAVVNDGWGLDDDSAAAHFVSSSRHRLKEIPLQALDEGMARREPVSVPIRSTPECSAFELGRSQLIRRLRRACGY